MIRLLVSVRNEDEARVALSGGAQLIDVKEPARGALGAADPHAIARVVNAVAGRVPVSAALGELSDPDVFERCATLPGVQFAKVGLAGMAGCADWRQRWREALDRLPLGVTPVAVAYADAHEARSPAIEDVLAQGIALGCAALLIDTFDKSQGNLLDQLDPLRLAAIASTARSAGLFLVAAGSLRREHLPYVAAAQPEYVGVRGAACLAGRESLLSANLVRQLVEQLATLASRQSAKPNREFAPT